MKNQLESMAKARAELLGLLTDANLVAPTHPKGQKRVQDVLCHLAQWERNVATSIEAQLQGGQFSIAPFDIHAINARIEAWHRNRTPAEVYQLLEDSRAQFLAALSSGREEEKITLPWGKAESPAHIADDMHKHELHHTQQVLSALQRG